MNIRGFVLAAIAGGTLFVIWLFVGLTMTVGAPLLFCLITAGLGGVLTGYLVLLYMVQGQRPTADVAAVAIVLGLVLPLTAVLYGAFGARKPAPAEGRGVAVENGALHAVKLTEAPAARPRAYTDAPAPAAPIAAALGVPQGPWKFTVTTADRWQDPGISVRAGGAYRLRAAKHPLVVGVEIEGELYAKGVEPNELGSMQGYHVLPTRDGKLLLRLPHGWPPVTVEITELAEPAREVRETLPRVGEVDQPLSPQERA